MWGGIERSMLSPLNVGGADGCEEGKTEGKSSGKAPALEDEAVILQFRIWLRNLNPMVWRRVQVPSTMTLRELHGVLQVALELPFRKRRE